MRISDKGLAARLREMKLKEAAEASAEDVERALDAKEQAKATVLEEATEPADEAGDAAPDEDIGLRPIKKGKDELRSWFLGKARPELPAEGLVTQVPPLPDDWVELDFQEIEPPFAFVRIIQSKRTGDVKYEVIEPPMSPEERRILAFVTDGLIRGLNVEPGRMHAQEREDFLMAAVRQIVRDYRVRLNKTSLARVEYYVRRDFLGLGPIHALMIDPNIEDISCDGPDQTLFVFHRRFESIPTSVQFESHAELDAFVMKMAQRSKKAISVSEPILDAALPDGSRLQATLGKEVTQNGSTFTIRRFKPDPFTPIDLVGFGTMDLPMLAWFWMTVQNRKNLVFSGGTASGKTTALNAVAQFIPQSAKVVSIEDTREVNLPHKNWIKAITRGASTTEGAGEIGMFELLKAALRQRPEYILVGEVRGIEATVAFQAMATGHTVYSTMHADSARSVVYRLENEPINIPRLVLQALDIIAIQAQVRFKNRRVRRVVEVVELVGLDPTTKELLTNTVFKWDPATDEFVYGGRSYLLERIAKDNNWSTTDLGKEYKRRQEVLRLLAEGGHRDVDELSKIIRAYNRDPDALLKRLREDL